MQMVDCRLFTKTFHKSVGNQGDIHLRSVDSIGYVVAACQSRKPCDLRPDRAVAYRAVAMMRWQNEIEELHDVFEAYFLGTIDTLERVEQVLADDFTIVGPDGIESSRAMTMQALRAAHGHTSSLTDYGDGRSVGG